MADATPPSIAMDGKQTMHFGSAATAVSRIQPDAGLRSMPDATDRTTTRPDPEPIRLAWEDREYGVWFKILQYETPRGVRWCHCYYASKSSDGGLMPNMQYTGRHHPAGLLTFGEATNLVILYAAGDKETCPRNECGYRDRPVTDQCRNRWCPRCAEAINLLGQSADPDCAACLRQHRDQIDQCLLGGANIPEANIVGDWHWFTGGTVRIQTDGAIASSTGNLGRWSRQGDVFVLRWRKGGYVDTLRLSADGRSLEGTNQHGARVTAGRVEHFNQPGGLFGRSPSVPPFTPDLQPPTPPPEPRCQNVCVRQQVKVFNTTDGRHGLCSGRPGKVWTGAIYVNCVQEVHCVEWARRCQ